MSASLAARVHLSEPGFAHGGTVPFDERFQL